MGRMMAKSLLLPFRWGDLADYARQLRAGWHGSRVAP
jgi:hypothetical protein